METKIGIIGERRNKLGQFQIVYAYCFYIFLGFYFLFLIIGIEPSAFVGRLIVGLLFLKVGLYFIKFPYNFIGHFVIDESTGKLSLEYKGKHYAKEDLFFLRVKANDYRGKIKRLTLILVILPGTDNFISFRVGDEIVDRRLFVKNRRQYRMLKRVESQQV